MLKTGGSGTNRPRVLASLPERRVLRQTLSESCSLPLLPACSVLWLPGDRDWLLPATLGTLHSRMGHWLRY